MRGILSDFIYFVKYYLKKTETNKIIKIIGAVNLNVKSIYLLKNVLDIFLPPSLTLRMMTFGTTHPINTVVNNTNANIV